MWYSRSTLSSVCCYYCCWRYTQEQRTVGFSLLLLSVLHAPISIAVGPLSRCKQCTCWYWLPIEITRCSPKQWSNDGMHFQLMSRLSTIWCVLIADWARLRQTSLIHTRAVTLCISISFDYLKSKLFFVNIDLFRVHIALTQGVCCVATRR